MIGELVAKLIAAGTTPELAAEVVAEAFAAGCCVSGGNRVDETLEKRRAWDREYRRNKRENPPESTRIHPTSESASISKDLKKDKRGTRIDVGWTPTDADKGFAKQEGFNDWEIQREAQKFRDYWTACAGAKGVKLDWPATWRQWIRSGADRAGKRPASNTESGTAGYYAQSESEQLAAWDAYALRETGKTLPRDRNFGWRVKSEWPPGYVKQREAAE